MDTPTVARGAQPARPQIRHGVGAVAIQRDERATFDALVIDPSLARFIAEAMTPATTGGWDLREVTGLVAE